jgi:hypothetical protein
MYTCITRVSDDHRKCQKLINYISCKKSLVFHSVWRWINMHSKFSSIRKSYPFIFCAVIGDRFLLKITNQYTHTNTVIYQFSPYWIWLHKDVNINWFIVSTLKEFLNRTNEWHLKKSRDAKFYMFLTLMQKQMFFN